MFSVHFQSEWMHAGTQRNICCEACSRLRALVVSRDCWLCKPKFNCHSGLLRVPPAGHSTVYWCMNVPKTIPRLSSGLRSPSRQNTFPGLLLPSSEGVLIVSSHWYCTGTVSSGKFDPFSFALHHDAVCPHVDAELYPYDGKRRRQIRPGHMLTTSRTLTAAIFACYSYSPTSRFKLFEIQD